MVEAKKTIRIILECGGGCVRNVYSSDPRVKVDLLDWDDVECDEATPAEKRRAKILATKAEKMHPVF